MTKFTWFPKIVKVLHIYYNKQSYNGYYDRTVKGYTITIGKYYEAEHNKTAGLNKGDKFIIKEHFKEI